MNLSEPLAIVLAALIGAVGGIVGTFVAAVLPERKKRPALLADFLDTIGQDVAEMVKKFEEEEIPHEAGHALDSKIEFFERATNRRLLSTTALETLDNLRKLSKDAETVDAYLYQGRNGDALRRDWIQKARGIVGELRGEASKLRAVG